MFNQTSNEFWFLQQQDGAPTPPAPLDQVIDYADNNIVDYLGNNIVATPP